MPKILRGVVPPVCTPFDSNYNIDEKSLRKLINHLIDGGVHGLFVLGSTSEVAFLTDAHRKRILEIAISENAGRVPLVAGVIGMTTFPVIEHVKVAVAAGVDGLVLTAPFYTRTHTAEIENHFRLVKAACPDTPLYAYDIPVAVNGVKLDADMLLRLGKDKIIQGVKDSSGSDASMRTLLLGRRKMKLDDFVILTGSEQTVDLGLFAGFDGVVPGFGNVDPRGYTDIYDAMKSGDYDKARTTQERLFEMFNLIEVAPASRMSRASSALGAFKEALKQLGVIENALMAPPYLPLSESEKAAITPYLVSGGLLKA